MGDVVTPSARPSVLSALATCVAPIVCTGDGLSYVLALLCTPHGMAGGVKGLGPHTATAVRVGGRGGERLNDAHKVGGGVTLTAGSEGNFSFFLCATHLPV